MPFRVPVTTQEPLEISSKEFNHKVMRYNRMNINGDDQIIHLVPQGHTQHIINVLIQTNVAQPSDANCRIDLQLKSSDQSGNVMFRSYMPDMTNQYMFINLSENGGYGTYDVTKTPLGNYRNFFIPIPPMVMKNGESIEINIFSMGANDDVIVYVAYEEVL